MYICPRCEKAYKEAPEKCLQCKRPLILNKRYRIEISVQSTPSGEDFDVLDLKRDEPQIMREMRVRKSDMGAQSGDIDAYKANVQRLKKMKYEGKKVLIDAFEAEYKNSVCYYYVFDADAWAGLGPDLDPGSGGGGDDLGLDDGRDPEPLPGREMDPELADYLASLEARAGGDEAPKKKAKAKAKSKDDDLDALPAKTSGDKAPAKKSAGGSAIATKAKVVIGVSLLVIILAAIAAFAMI